MRTEADGLVVDLDEPPVRLDDEPVVEVTQPRSWAQMAGAFLALVALMATLYGGVTFAQVVAAEGTNEARPVDAIVVLGAAQFDGEPSPVLERRLDRALLLRFEGYASMIVTTGAAGPGDTLTEGFVSYTYLRERDVPDEDIVVVTDGTNTYESLSATANALDAAGLGNDVLLVSDPYHALRAVEIAREVGLDATFVSAEVSSSFDQLVRESVAVSVGRLIGYRRVSNLT